MILLAKPTLSKHLLLNQQETSGRPPCVNKLCLIEVCIIMGISSVFLSSSTDFCWVSIFLADTFCLEKSSQPVISCVLDCEGVGFRSVFFVSGHFFFLCFLVFLKLVVGCCVVKQNTDDQFGIICEIAFLIFSFEYFLKRNYHTNVQLWCETLV